MKPKFRNKESIKEYWQLIKDYFNTDFKVGVYQKNSRAINFLEKNHCKKIQEVEISPDTMGLIYEYKVGA